MVSFSLNAQSLPRPIENYLYSQNNPVYLRKFAHQSLQFLLSLKTDDEFYAFAYFLAKKPLPHYLAKNLGRNKIMRIASFFSGHFNIQNKKEIYHKENILKLYMQIILNQ